ncbi:MAG TPA: hypothetical protein VKR22_00110 [Acidimicrobiales bacterium]|nr:hypothetical protein [Acidimicrobiales bacterium]
MAEPRRWFDSSQPQTLQGAVMLCYITAFFGILGVILGQVVDLVPLGLGVGGFAVANERRWGYVLAVVLAVVNVLVLLGAIFGGVSVVILNLLFAVVLLALLLHPQSREYQRIWFK